MKKLLITALIGCMLLVQAAALPEMGALHAKSAALYAANGQMLYEFNADEQLQPASVTKIMTMLLAMEALERGEVTLDTMITGSEYACSMGGTQIWLEPGEQLSLNDMLKAIAVGSANDCAVAVAEHLAGTEAAFVERMNTRAAELGCTGTQFINANGLDGIGQKTMTTARDLALISCELLKHPKILDYTGIWMDTVRGGKFGLANTNKMLKSYQGLTGLKTGYISEAGFCISASAERDGLSIVAVVMAAPTKEDRMADATALLNYGFANFAVYTPPADVLRPVPVKLGKTDTVQPAMESSSLVIEKAKAAELETTLDLPETLTAPVEQGQTIGELTVSSGGETVLRVPLTAAEAVEAKGIGSLFLDFWGGMLGG
ncbi:D-alanyl-D-alanine carboxypeptidase family protein [Agathobaculum sp. NTUH-O15-33]|uniref:D-alanyl-D-alanine carboxypeptidase family protein n=1 Tax=Agathobaculum sp. NTUH-O15-33 TaxID=3079302 RepID=UPI0029588CE8|nr:D-alanyl-D-alanine carboxypeptidase family protein [Agathobaculum sp. NTUH-O15-33]WNX83607.1 D-alanyl-D-alanine carboxypeptidase family protein [Agathobaculum sp. NTUH-O15-33]